MCACVNVCVCDYCHLRIGPLSLSSLGSRIFCGAGVRNPVVDVLGTCERWTDRRSEFQSVCQVSFTSLDRITHRLVRLRLAEAGLSQAMYDVVDRCDQQNPC